MTLPTSPPQDALSTKRKAYERRIMLISCWATAIMIMGVSSVMPMIPLLAKEFNVSLKTATLVITAFTLPGIFFAPFAGMMADRYGRRAVFAPSIVLFCGAGVACVFASNFSLLLALRFVQGIGAASFGLLNTTILGDTFSGTMLSRMMGYSMGALSAATALFPALGGFLALYGWHGPFLLPLLSLPLLALVCITPLATPGKESSFRSYLHELNLVFHKPEVFPLLLMTFFTFAMLFGPVVTCFPILGATVFGLSPASIGSLMMAGSLGAAIMAAKFGTLLNRFGGRDMLLGSQVCYVLALVSLPQITDYRLLPLPLFLYGMGQGLNTPTIQTRLLGVVPTGQRASLMAFNGTVLRLGQTVSPPLFGLLVEWQGITSGIYGALLLVAVLCTFTLCYFPKHGAAKA